ncbi:MAG: hypothetical protein DRH57_08380 [Candidatus Cloacimonadota bacterium]|nr:MAG: hypothetical protein DRH57_08380 [Candidatus Cloacimonadota bacterium]
MEVVYVRFGMIPENGKSYNSLDEFYEEGVSVYEALHRDGQFQLLLPMIDETSIATLGNCYNTAQCLSGQIYHYSRLNLVEGEYIGNGSDGEPLLKNCKIIRPIFEKEINEWRNTNG